MKKHLILFSLLLISAFCHAQTMNKIRKYVNDNNNIVSITYPAEWVLLDYQDISLMFLRPVKSSSDTGFRENFNLVVSSGEGISDIASYAQQIPEYLKANLQDFSIESSVVIDVNHLKCSKSVYYHTMSGKILKVMLFGYIVGDKIYNITCSATKESFDKYAAVFDKIGKSFGIE